jgi:ferric-dicitrate binding protein FerR (iron transport regulator)
VKISDEQLFDFLRGNVNEELRQAVEEWYFASEENQKKLEQFFYVVFLNDLVKIEKEIDTEKSWNKLQAILAAKEEKRREAQPKRRMLHWKQIAVAAVFIGMIFAGGISLKRISDKMTQPFIVSTNLGERSNIILPDGSKVWLNSYSRIEYKESFWKRKRNVTMLGEAYFEVYSDKNAPFIVNSRSLNTTVLGTKFNIRANIDDSYIVTTLLEGAVSVSRVDSPEKENLKMKSNQQLTYDCNTGKTVLSDCTSAKDYISWIDNKLYFEKASLLEITKSLERHYNIHFVFLSEEIKNEIFTCDFQTNENIYQVLSILKLTGKFDYKVENRIVTLFSKTNNRKPV